MKGKSMFVTTRDAVGKRRRKPERGQATTGLVREGRHRNRVVHRDSELFAEKKNICFYLALFLSNYFHPNILVIPLQKLLHLAVRIFFHFLEPDSECQTCAMLESKKTNDLSIRDSEESSRFLFSFMKYLSFLIRAAFDSYIFWKISFSNILLQLFVHTPPGHLRQQVGQGDGRSTEIGPVKRTTVGGTVGGGGTATTCVGERATS
jgi:hypothetical protein